MYLCTLGSVVDIDERWLWLIYARGVMGSNSFPVEISPVENIAVLDVCHRATLAINSIL